MTHIRWKKWIELKIQRNSHGRCWIWWWDDKVILNFSGVAFRINGYVTKNIMIFWILIILIHNMIEHTTIRIYCCYHSVTREPQKFACRHVISCRTYVWQSSLSSQNKMMQCIALIISNIKMSLMTDYFFSRLHVKMKNNQ